MHPNPFLRRSKMGWGQIEETSRVGSLSPRTLTPKRRIIMDRKKRLIVLTVSFAIVALGALSWAADGGVKIPLMAAKPHPGASGTAIIMDQSISIQARGLKPNAVYTGWFVNMKPKKHVTGAGESPYMFKTDSYGSGTYSATLKGSPFGKWQMLMIMLHPTGDPKDMKNMVGALKANIQKSN